MRFNFNSLPKIIPSNLHTAKSTRSWRNTANVVTIYLEKRVPLFPARKPRLRSEFDVTAKRSLRQNNQSNWRKLDTWLMLVTISFSQGADFKMALIIENMSHANKFNRLPSKKRIPWIVLRNLKMLKPLMKSPRRMKNILKKNENILYWRRMKIFCPQSIKPWIPLFDHKDQNKNHLKYYWSAERVIKIWIFLLTKK